MAARWGRKPRTRRLSSRGRLLPPDELDHLVSVGVSIAGPVALWSSSDSQEELRDLALTAYDDAGAVRYSVRLAELPVEYPLVDVLTDGSFLVVGARCQWRSSGPDLNALAIDQDGTITRRGCLGDGIEHVQVASDGTIWAGYFDEGVFGNYGWLDPGPDPLGSAGIVQWSPDFDKLWELDAREGIVADCYSLNVADDVVLSCPYTDFPVLRIAGGRHQVFPTKDVGGGNGIVALGDWIGLVGSYRDPSLLVLGALERQVFVESERARLRGPDGAELAPGQVHCRGPVAHFFVGADWFSLSLEDLVT